MVTKSAGGASKPRKPAMESTADLASQLSRRIVGQPAAIRQIIPYIRMFEAGLAPEGRPVGVFLLLGPTGTGKTRTVEALAEALHGSEKCVLKVDCGEYQMDHEVAKLIGAPPGYLGHRETVPMLTQQKLHAVTSERSKLSLVLFDEIEKAAPSLTRLLLGVLDRATLRLGDNTTVNFENSLIFLTSNLGAREMMRELNPDFGFRAGAPRSEVTGRLEAIGMNAVRRRFSPEFVNRIDAVITYRPLDEASLQAILEQQIAELQRLIDTRLGEQRFDMEVSAEARQFLLRQGTSREYGARELKRTIHRHLTQPLAALVAGGAVAAGGRVNVVLEEDGSSLAFRTAPARAVADREQPVVLLVDDNRELLRYLEKNVAQTGWRSLAAQSARQAYEQLGRRLPDAALLDHLLPDGSGIELAVELRRRGAQAPIIIMTGAPMGPEEEAVCQEYDFPVLRKPFLAADMIRLLRARLGCEYAASA